MIAWAVAAGWAAGVVVLGACLADPPPRTPPRAAPSTPPGPLRRRIPALFAVVVIGVVGGVLPAVAALIVLVVAPWWISARREAARQRRARAALPGALELVALGLRAGCTPAHALLEASEHVDPAVGEPLRSSGDLLARGRPAREALGAFESTWGDVAGRLVDVLDSATELGVGVADAIRQLAAETRDDRRRTVEARVRRLPVLLLGPLVVCILPAFVLLVVVPFVVSGLAALPLAGPP